jgi:hypothetical protein
MEMKLFYFKNVGSRLVLRHMPRGRLAGLGELGRLVDPSLAKPRRKLFESRLNASKEFELQKSSSHKKSFFFFSYPYPTKGARYDMFFIML